MKDKALKLALEALEELADLMDDTRAGRYEPDSFTTQPARTAITAIKQARSAPVQEPLSELEKDAANLLFALHDAWPYVHSHCTIESKKKPIQALMVKHGDFADLQPPAAQRQWVGLTLSDREKLRDQFEGWNYPAILVDAINDILKDKNT